MVQPQIFELGEEVTFSTLGTDFAGEYGVEDVVGTIDAVKRTPRGSMFEKMTDWVYDILVDDFHGKPWVFQEMGQCLIGKLDEHDMEQRLYERGQIVRFGDGGLVGEVVIVDNRYREYGFYCSDWSYDIMVEGEQYGGGACIYKHVPQFKVLEVVR